METPEPTHETPAASTGEPRNAFLEEKAFKSRTVLVFGETGIRHGAGMKRGTIGLFAGGTPDMLPTFRYACTCRPTFLRLYLRHLAALGFAVPEGCLDAAYRRYCGDFLEMAKGEILVREAA